MVDVYIPEQDVDENLRNDYHTYAKAGTLDVLGATLDETLYYNPANAAARLADQYLFQGTRGRTLSKDEWASSEFFREDITVGDEGITEGLAGLLAERHDERLAFNTTLQRSRGGLALGAAQFGVSLAGSLVDPLNVASAFIPSVGLARMGAIASRAGGRRFATGVVDGAIGAAVVEPLVMGAAIAEQDKDYGLMDSFMNIALGSALGGGLHWGVGKLTDRINKAPPQVRDQAQVQAIARVGNDQEVDAGDVIARSEDTPYDPNPQGEQVVAYDKDGNPEVVEVVSSNSEGQVVVRKQDGSEHILDLDEVVSKSIYDEDFAVSIDDGEDIRLSSLNDDEFKQIESVVDDKINLARETGDETGLKSAEREKKGIEIEKRRRAGETIERPEDPRIEATVTQQIAELEAENQRIKDAVEQRRINEGLDKPKVKVSELQKISENEQKIAALEAQMNQQADQVAVREKQLTPEQEKEFDPEQAVIGMLGRLAEFKGKADEIEARPEQTEDLDPQAMQSEVDLMEAGLRDSEDFDLLPDEVKKDLDFKDLDEKVEAYDEIVEAGRFCVVGGKQ